MSCKPNIRVETAREEDMPRCMELVLDAFGPFPNFDVIGGPNTEENRKLTAERHLRGYREHLEKYPSVSPGIKCVHTDPETGEEKIVGFAEWFVYDRERTEEEYMTENYILRMEWIEDEAERRRCLDGMAQEFAMRRRVMGGRPFALLCYMCVDPGYRRRGVATACVRWGMERCAELGIPGYLEASEEGRRTYETLGWEVYEGGGEVGEMMFPPMIWWPENAERW